MSAEEAIAVALSRDADGPLLFEVIAFLREFSMVAKRTRNLGRPQDELIAMLVGRTRGLVTADTNGMG
jgi:hypothetical protein